MENKLTLEHLAPYLPYGVLFISEMDKPYDEYGRQPIWTLNGISEMFGDYCLLTKQNSDAYDIVTCKPILRPLSDLTKEIEHNGEKFVPILELAKASDSFYDWEISKQSLFHKSAFCNHYTGKLSFSINTDFKKLYSINTTLNGYFIQTNNPHLVYQKLIEWHFDVFGLIDKGLAVDINTLKGGQNEKD